MGTTSALSSLSGAVGGTTTSGGLGAGINVAQFVQFAVANQTASITALQTQQTTLGSQSGELATSTCPQTAQEYFIAGSEPTQLCELHGGHNAQSAPGSWLSHLFGRGSSPAPPPPAADGSSQASAPNASRNARPATNWKPA